MVLHEIESAPTSDQVNAAVTLVEKWSRARRQVSPGGSVKFALPVFDYGVSLSLWRQQFGIVKAGEEMAHENLPLHLQTLLVSSHTRWARNVGFPAEVEVKIEHGGEKFMLKYAVQERVPTLALQQLAGDFQFHEWNRRPLPDPLSILGRPVLLLRIFDLLFEVPFTCFSPHSDAKRLIGQHLTQLPSSTNAPNAPVPLAILLRDLRIVFECDHEVEERIERPLAGVRRARVATMDTVREREAREAHAEQAEYFLIASDWEELARTARAVPGIQEWVTHVQHGWMQKLELFLRDEQVAHAHAEMELSWDRSKHLSFTRTVGRSQSEDLQVQVDALAKRNISAWRTAMEWFETFFNNVSDAAPAHSLGKRADPPLAYHPLPRRQF